MSTPAADGTYRATVTRLDSGVPYVEVPRLGIGVEFAAPDPLCTVAPGDRVTVSTVAGIKDEVVILGNISNPGASGARRRTTFTTASVTGGSNTTGTVTLATAYRLLHIETDVPARVRLYTTAASRTADLTRTTVVDPDPGIGIMLDFVTVSLLLDSDLAPTVDGFNGESSPTAAIPYTVTPADTGPVTVTLTWVGT